MILVVNSFRVSPVVRNFSRCLGLGLALWAAAAAAQSDSLWNALKHGGYVIVMRHAQTEPGTLDPPGYTLEDCGSQRKLSDAGRAQARRLGAAFRAHEVPVGRVMSSRFCRCIDTAALAFGRVEPWEMLDNVGHDEPARRQEKRDALREIARRWGEPGNLVLVTHGFNIQDATGVLPAQGEMLVLRPLGEAGFRVAGRLPAD